MEKALLAVERSKTITHCLRKEFTWLDANHFEECHCGILKSTDRYMTAQQVINCVYGFMYAYEKEMGR